MMMNNTNGNTAKIWTERTAVPNTNELPAFTYKTKSGNKYVVKSVFVGDIDIQTAILKIAEKKALQEMGLNYPTL